jgi:hypothetical protein
MRKDQFKCLAALAGALSFAGMANAAIIVDGTLDAGYGAPLATQTINTGFGDSTIGDGTSAGGSELDAGYGVISGGNLNLFFAGNFENNGNHVNIFISDGTPGASNTLNASSSTGSLSASNGMVFPAGFNPSIALDGNDYSDTFYFDQYSLVSNTASYIGSVPLSSGIGSGTLNGIAFGINNTNGAGVNSNSGTAASATAADAVTTGLEISIPLSSLGTGPYEVLADINGGGDSYLSNQFLGGLPVGTQDLGSPGSVNLNGITTPFVVPVPEPTTAVLLGIGGFVLRRRRPVASA